VSSDQRVHARIHVQTKIDVVGTDQKRVEAELRDLSKGGARFEIAASLGAVGERIQLYLPSLTGTDITVSAEIIRRSDAGEGKQVYAVRFDDVEEEKREQLLELIEVLLTTSGGGRRAHPRVARRIEVRFGQLDDLRAILEDISAGGLLMTVNEPLSLYEELDITVPDLGGGELIILHARVVNQRAEDRPSGHVYRVGLEFTSLRPETHRVITALLQSVLEAMEEPGGDPPSDT
jgi:c-di-GMP-binding flagellar brake protein YcgR